MKMFTAPKLKVGDTIGIFCASHIYTDKWYARDLWTLERLGFKVKVGKNARLDTYGYAASSEERAADINALVTDDEVKMLLFGGGAGAAEVLPFIDFENIRKHPKLFSSYSDGTSILNTIYAQTGLVTYYGQGPGEFAELRQYDWEQFKFHFMGDGIGQFFGDSKWKTLRGGKCSGTLIGGYTSVFAMLQGSKYFRYDDNRKYLLFLEDHEKLQRPAAVATCMAYIEQSAFMDKVVGLIFGHYATEVPEVLFGVLTRFAERHNIPAVYTDDFGHGFRHAILPIGMNATLDANAHTLVFEGVAE